MTGQDYKNEICKIRDKFLNGYLTYDEAKKEAQPIINDMNEKAREIAKKWGRKHTNFTFSALIR